MNYFNKSFCLEVWGEYACFTRPEMKVERVSYDVPTPSAVRAIFEAIFWKPAIKWQVEKIEVLEPIKWISVRRNEVGAVMSERSDGILIEDARQQRAGLFLRDVRYRLHAQLVYIPERDRPASIFVPPELGDQKEEQVLSEIASNCQNPENPGKYNAMFERRVKKGQCFNQPYLGCREFSSSFRIVENPGVEQQAKPAINESRDLGFMLFDLYDHDEQGNAKAAFYRPVINNGVILVPGWESEEVKK